MRGAMDCGAEMPRAASLPRAATRCRHAIINNYFRNDYFREIPANRQ
jgi:hypothetical protein